MSLQAQPELCSEKDTTEDQQEDQKCNTNDLVCSSITPDSDKDEGSQFQEGGVRGWATLIGA